MGGGAGRHELVNDGITASEAIAGIFEATIIEETPNYPKGPSVLLLQDLSDGSPIHVVWGISRGHDLPAILVIAYRPDPARAERIPTGARLLVSSRTTVSS